MPAPQSLITGAKQPAATAQVVGYITYAGNPTNNVTPAFIGQECFDTSGANFYVATTTASSGWKATTA